jgi:hypothetical protein
MSSLLLVPLSEEMVFERSADEEHRTMLNGIALLRYLL